jgi:pyruvate,water dikinase
LSGVSGPSGTEYDFRLRYETFRSLLTRNVVCLEILSNLEADLGHVAHGDSRIQRSVRRLVDEATLMAQELNLVSSNRYDNLYAVLEQIRRDISTSFGRTPKEAGRALAVPLDGAESRDLALVGGKAHGLASLSQALPGAVPPGFTITTAAYQRLLEENDLRERIMLMFQDLDVVADRDQFRSRIDTIRSWITSASIPDAVRRAIDENATGISADATSGWAVRSSAVDEDGSYSFAGQFETLLGVGSGDLESAYLQVVASRFTERAVRYRLHVGLREIEVPMAVLFMPLVDASASGVIHTSDPKEPARGVMVVYAAHGLGKAAAMGVVHPDTILVSKERSPRIVKVPAEEEGRDASRPDYVGEDAIRRLCELAHEAEASFGHPLEIEWALDRGGNIRLLQARRLQTADAGVAGSGRKSKRKPLVEGGVTVFPGQAEGRLVSWRPEADPDSIPNGAVLVVGEPTPELAAVLPKAAAVVAAEGHPGGHAANLAREFSVPCVFRMGPATERLLLWNIASVDATNRAVYEGSLWPGMKERVAARIASARWRSPSGPLHDLVIELNLNDPDSSSFKAGSCRSVHDVLRFVHEMSVRSLFGFGDKSRRGWKGRRHQLEADIPVGFTMIDLDGSLPSEKAGVEPADVDSIPFQAFWRGISDDRLRWTQRWQRATPGVPDSFRKAVLDGGKGPRRASDKNYAMIARNYMNLNARFAYHYAMVDAVVGQGSESNHIHFRFRGGGAGTDKKERRVRFLEEVLRGIGFGTSRRGDMVTAWFSRYPLEDSREAMEHLGRLTVCAQELDAVMNSDTDVRVFAGKFLDGEYEIFL